MSDCSVSHLASTRSCFPLPTLLLEEEKHYQKESAAAQGAFSFTCLALHLQV